MENLDLTVITPEFSKDEPYYIRMYKILGFELHIEETTFLLPEFKYAMILKHEGHILHYVKYDSIEHCQETAVRLLKLYFKEIP